VDDWILKYRNYEVAKGYKNFENAIVRETISELASRGILNPDIPLEIATFSDMPGRTGLGSSAAFGVALVSALMYWVYPGHHLNDSLRASFAQIAYEVARKRLKQETGIQDFYATAFGHCRINEYFIDGKIVTTKIDLSEFPFFVYLYDLKIRRDSDAVLKETEISEEDRILRDWGFASATCIRERDWSKFFKILDEQDKRKMERISEISEIKSEIKKIERMKGVKCVKTVGAGRGGYLLVFSDYPIEKSRFEPILISESGVEVHVI
jgi:D-glycero-alpha-D-manno-heptose-7-phosphate kinase